MSWNNEILPNKPKWMDGDCEIELIEPHRFFGYKMPVFQSVFIARRNEIGGWFRASGHGKALFFDDYQVKRWRYIKKN